MRKLLLISVLPILLLSVGISGCSSASETTFGIYLLDSGELVLSGEHIRTYHQDTHTLELNKAGIEKWNSYQTYNYTPKLKDTLYLKDFVVKVGQEEIYHGKFWSGVSSSLYEGHIILESLFKLDEDHDYIWIEFGHLPSTDGVTDMRDDGRIIEFFDDKGILQ